MQHDARARLPHQSNLCGSSYRTMRVAAAAASPPQRRRLKPATK
jgi:hypothetical protein